MTAPRQTRQTGRTGRTDRTGRPVPAPARPGARPPARNRGGTRPLRLGSPRPRLRLIGAGLTLVMLVFTVRLLQVQAVDASAYAARANVNRYIPVTLAAERGNITDRSGVNLATTVDAYDITAA
ncbi:cell division protein, partial [Streptomyces sp. NPDC049577]